MSTISYGILGSSGGFIATSATVRGAKNKATRDGVDQVWAMCGRSWAVWIVSTKIGGRWLVGEGFDTQQREKYRFESGSAYAYCSNAAAYLFIGKLNGRTKKQFIEDYEAAEGDRQL